MRWLQIGLTLTLMGAVALMGYSQARRRVLREVTVGAQRAYITPQDSSSAGIPTGRVDFSEPPWPNMAGNPPGPESTGQTTQAEAGPLDSQGASDSAPDATTATPPASEEASAESEQAQIPTVSLPSTADAPASGDDESAPPNSPEEAAQGAPAHG